MNGDPTIVLSAQDNASRVLANVRAEIAEMSDSTAKLRMTLAGIGGGVTVGAFTAFIRTTVLGIDALNDLKDATGASIENISALEDVAARTGTSFDSMGTSLVKFNAALNNAQPGSTAARAFDALGLSVANLKSLDPAEALRQTASALSRFADDGNKARFIQELFGKSLREVAPFLADLANQTQLVAKVTSDQAAEAERFNQQLSALQKNSEDAKRSLIFDLVVGINSAAKAWRESGLIDAFGTLAFGNQQYRSDVKFVSMTERTLAAEKALAEARSAGLPEDSPVVKRAKAGLAALQEELKTLKQVRAVNDSDNQSEAETKRLMGKGKSTLPDLTGRPRKDVKERTVEIEDNTRAVYSYLQSLQKQLEKELELDEVQVARRQLERMGPVSLERAGPILQLAEQIKKERELKHEREENLKLMQALDAGLVAGDQVFGKRLQELIDATPAAELERARKDQLLLAQAFTEGAISQEQYLQAAAARAGITDKALENTKTLAEELGLTFESAFENAMVGGKGLSTVLKGLQHDLLRIIVRDTVTKPLANWTSGKLPALFGGFFADGGVPPLGKVSVVGERGPELFVPRERGTIIPNGGGLGAPVTISIVQPVGDIATVSMLQQSNKALVRQIQGALVHSMTRGGVFSTA